MTKTLLLAVAAVAIAGPAPADSMSGDFCLDVRAKNGRV